MPSETADTIVIGAGVVGLAVARQLALAGREVLVLEANDAFGMETSSRNSGVIHAGIYYLPGSLKSRSCLRGKQLLYGYCARRQVTARCCGKLIVATTDAQRERLHALQVNALAAGLEDLQWLEPAQVNALEPDVRASAGLYSPSTGIIDVHELMLALLADFEAAGGVLVTRTRVLGGKPGGSVIGLEVDDGKRFTLNARTVVNAAGHGATAIAGSIAGLNNHHIPHIFPVRGHYFEHSGKLPFAQLIYPLPGETGLGVHVTIDSAGQARFGPDNEYCATVDYRFDETRKARFVEAIRDWYPQLDETRLHPGFVGVRPSLQPPGEDQRDFVLSGPTEHGINGLLNLFGIDSPGLTACMALAEEVLAKLDN